MSAGVTPHVNPVSPCSNFLECKKRVTGDGAASIRAVLQCVTSLNIFNIDKVGGSALTLPSQGKSIEIFYKSPYLVEKAL